MSARVTIAVTGLGEELVEVLALAGWHLLADPRANQRRRTRAAVMEGARALLREGQVPSIADAAEEAGVSRATAYRYFPTQGSWSGRRSTR